MKHEQLLISEGDMRVEGGLTSGVLGSVWEMVPESMAPLGERIMEAICGEADNDEG